TSDQIRASAICPTAAAPWLSSSFSVRRGSFRRLRPSAMAPDDTISSSRPSRCSLARSAASAASHCARTSPTAESISSDEPTLTTMRRKFFSSGRDMGGMDQPVGLPGDGSDPDCPPSWRAKRSNPDRGRTHWIASSQVLLAMTAGVQRDDLDSAHHEGIELVAFGIPEIGGVKLLAALSRRALATAAERERELVNAIDLGLVLGAERRHHAVADRHRLAVMGNRDTKSRAAAGTAPGNDAIVGHEAAHAQFAADLVVEV